MYSGIWFTECLVKHYKDRILVSNVSGRKIKSACLTEFVKLLIAGTEIVRLISRLKN